MQGYILLSLALLGAVAAVPASQDRIVGGSTTTINQYPSMTPVLYTWDYSSFWQRCAGTILNTRSILSCAHCYVRDFNVNNWRLRVGSTFANSGGVVHNVASFIIHPNYDGSTYDNDVAILRTATAISYVANTVQPSSIAGLNYNLADGAVVWAAGWGATFQHGWNVENLRHVQVWTINQAICRERYATRNLLITDNMLCSGWLDVGGRDQCGGDSGGPLLHNNIVVGICSWGLGCADRFFPGVNARVSRYTTWIQANA